MALQLQAPSPIKPGEWHDLLWHQCMNCVDSLRAQAAESSTIPGLGPGFKSHPSWETFEGNVGILEAMCDGYDLLDEAYKKAIPKGAKKTPKEVFAALIALLKRQKFWKEGRPYLGRI